MWDAPDPAMDRGLCIVLTMITGAAIFIAEACSGESHPPATTDLGNRAPAGDPGASVGRGAAPTSGAIDAAPPIGPQTQAGPDDGATVVVADSAAVGP
jgi:hypothetical protein